jgi:hypothetical protein
MKLNWLIYVVGIIGLMYKLRRVLNGLCCSGTGLVWSSGKSECWAGRQIGELIAI